MWTVRWIDPRTDETCYIRHIKHWIDAHEFVFTMRCHTIVAEII